MIHIDGKMYFASATPLAIGHIVETGPADYEVLSCKGDGGFGFLCEVEAVTLYMHDVEGKRLE
jgi:hypothetical protein